MGSGAVERWLGRLGERTGRVGLVILRCWLRWLGERGGSFAGLGPDGLVEWQRSHPGDYALVDLLEEYIDCHPEWSVGHKRKVLSTIRSFFMHNRAPMPPDPSYRIRSDKEPVVSRLTVEEFRKIVLASNPTYRAVWLCMLQAGMGCNEVIYWSDHGWPSLKRQLREGRHPIRIELPGRKRNRNVKPYYTFIGRDAIEALEAYLEQRPNVDGPIFITKFGQPLTYWTLWRYWMRKLRELGLIKPRRGRGVRYGKNPHAIRSLFRSRWRLSGCDPEVAEFFLGHDIDKLGYDKSPWLSPEWFEEQYCRAERWLNIISEEPEKVPAIEVTRLRRELEELKRMVKMLKEAGADQIL